MNDTGDPFDRELAEYDAARERLELRAAALREQESVWLSGRDQRRLADELQLVEGEAENLERHRAKYIQDRDYLRSLGCLEGDVLPGSIVTVKYPDSRLYTFVLTARDADSGYPTQGYQSSIGEPIRRRRAGDIVTLAGGVSIEITDVRPGFSIPEVNWRASPPSPDTQEQWLAEQRCRDNHYSQALRSRIYEPQVAPINEYVTLLREQHRDDSIPFVAPSYGGVNARLLTLMQDPGPKTNRSNADRSGLLCIENYDLSAARQKYFLNTAGIDASQIVSWNAYPWPLPKKPTEESDREAAEALGDFLTLCPNLEVVILNGLVARKVWRELRYLEPEATRDLTVLATYHTSPTVITNPRLDPDEVNADLSEKYREAGEALRTPTRDRIELVISVTSKYDDEQNTHEKTVIVAPPPAEGLKSKDSRLNDWAMEELIPHTDHSSQSDVRAARFEVEVIETPSEYSALRTCAFAAERLDRT